MAIPANPEFAHGSDGYVGLGTAAAPLVPQSITKYVSDNSDDESVDNAEVTTLQPAGSRKSFVYGLSTGTNQITYRCDAPAGEFYRMLGDIVRSKKPVRLVHCPFGEGVGKLRIWVDVLITSRNLGGGTAKDVGGTFALQQTGEVHDDVVPAGGVNVFA